MGSYFLFSLWASSGGFSYDTTVTVAIPDPYPHSESPQTVIYTIGCVLESPVVLLKINVLRLEGKCAL